MRGQTDYGAYLPTPEEIARVAAELRAKALAAKLNDPVPKRCRIRGPAARRSAPVSIEQNEGLD